MEQPVASSPATARGWCRRRYVDFLETAWAKWVALEHRDPSFVGPPAVSHRAVEERAPFPRVKILVTRPLTL